MSCISEILKIKGDKEFLVAEIKGEKIDLAVEGGGIYREYEYLITLNDFGIRCGYVALPHNSKANDIINSGAFNKYNDLDIECHGGLTFVSSGSILKYMLPTFCEDNWIGFDCNHFSDSYDIETAIKYFGDKSIYHIGLNYKIGKIRNFSYVEEECKNIIDQLIEKY